jgi:hypothetical protein
MLCKTCSKNNENTICKTCILENVKMFINIIKIKPTVEKQIYVYRKNEKIKNKIRPLSLFIYLNQICMLGMFYYQ